MFYDAHTHLNSPQLMSDYLHHVQSFVDQWGEWIAIIGTSLEDSLDAIKLVQLWRSHFPWVNLWAVVGFHPEFVRDYNRKTLQDLIHSHREYIIGIGECGTDLHRPAYAQWYEKQLDVFADQCQLAVDMNLPVVIHSRADRSWTYKIVSQFPTLKLYFHCRGYTTNELQIIQETLPNQVWIWFCGNVTYPKALELRESLTYCIDHDIKILLETDAPYLAPQAIRGQQNSPACIHHTYKYCSDYLHIPQKILQQIIKDNRKALYEPTL